MKKFISLLVALSISISMITGIGVYAEEAQTEASVNAENISDTVAEESAETSDVTENNESVQAIPEAIPATEDMLLLNAIGIFNEGMLEKAGQNVKRGDFAEIAVKFANVTPEQAKMIYSDISGEAANYAATAVSLGLMDDGLVGNFKAEKEISGINVAMCIANCLGYQDEVKKLGGYDKTAAKYSLCKGIDYLSSVTYAQVARNLVNALSMKPVPMYSIVDDKKIYLEEVLYCKVLTGQVMATSLTGLNGVNKAREGYVIIGDQEFLVDFDVNDYLGSEIKFIVREGNDSLDDERILYVYPNLREEELVIKDKNLLDFDGTNYVYADENGRKKREKVSRNKIVIFNGIERREYMNDDLTPENGWVRLVDANGDGEIDVVFVYSGKTMIVEAADTKYEKIVDMHDMDLMLDYSGIDSVKVIRNGANTDVSALRKGDVLNIFESADKSVLTIYANSQKIQGVVTGENKDVDDRSISVDYEPYEIDVIYYDKYVKNTGTVFGKAITGYTDSFGKMVYAEFSEVEMNLGYLIDVKYIESDTEYFTFRLYTGEKEFTKIKSASEKVTVDGRKCERDEVLRYLNKDKGATVSTEVMPQLIRYALDKDGLLIKIDTPYNNQPAINALSNTTEKAAARAEFKTRMPNDREGEDSFRILHSSYIAPSSHEGVDGARPISAGGASNMFFGQNFVVMRIKDGAQVFIVPPDNEAKSADIKKFSIAGINYYQGDYAKLEGYVFGNSFAADVSLVKSESAVSGKPTKWSSRQIHMVTKIEQTLDEDNEIVTRIHISKFDATLGTDYYTTKDEEHWKNVWPAGDAYDAESRPDGYYVRRELGVGDVVRFDVDRNGNILQDAIIYDADIADDVIEKQKARFEAKKDELLIWDKHDMFKGYEVTKENPIEQMPGSSRMTTGINQYFAPMPRIAGDNTTDGRAWLLDVYDIEGDYAKTTFHDLRTYEQTHPENKIEDLEFSIERLTFPESQIIYLDKTSPKFEVTYSGGFEAKMNVNDIRSYVSSGNGYTRIIPVMEKGAWFDKIFIIKEY